MMWQILKQCKLTHIPKSKIPFQLPLSFRAISYLNKNKCVRMNVITPSNINKYFIHTRQRKQRNKNKHMFDQSLKLDDAKKVRINDQNANTQTMITGSQTLGAQTFAAQPVNNQTSTTSYIVPYALMGAGIIKNKI